VIAEAVLVDTHEPDPAVEDEELVVRWFDG
jgi:hypothetical protein